MKKIAFISGGSRGIGHAILKKLLKENYITIASTTTSNGADKINNTISDLNGEGVAVIGDLLHGLKIIHSWEKIIIEKIWEIARYPCS